MNQHCGRLGKIRLLLGNYRKASFLSLLHSVVGKGNPAPLPPQQRPPNVSSLAAAQLPAKPSESLGMVTCYHCGASCGGAAFPRAEKVFCCAGCLTVFELLAENGLTDFYQLASQPGIRVAQTPTANRFAFLDEPAVRAQLVDFSDVKLTRVTFQLPAIHCIACVWLLENLFRLQPGVGQSQVNFARKEAAIAFDPAQVKLSGIAALLTSLGYEPELKLSDLETKPANPAARRLWLQLGVAGFAFGNAMFFAITGYFGLDAFTGPQLKVFIGWLNLLLAVPVVTFSAADYYLSAWASLRQRLLNIDVPIAAGIVAIFAQSVWEVASGGGKATSTRCVA